MQPPGGAAYLCGASGGSGAVFPLFAVLHLSGIRGLAGAFATCLLLFCALTARAQRTPLLRDLSLRTDTVRYSLSRNTALVQGEAHLYFSYRQDDEVAELLVYPETPGRPGLRLQRSADFTLLDSLTAVDGGQYYRAKVRFKDLSSNKFLSLTFRQPSDSVGFAPQTQTVKLLPVTRTTLEFRPSDTELFVGEEKVFELSSNNAKNIRVSPEWTRGQDIDYRLEQERAYCACTCCPTPWAPASSPSGPRPSGPSSPTTTGA